MPALGGSVGRFRARIFPESAHGFGGGPRQGQIGQMSDRPPWIACPHGPVAGATSDRTTKKDEFRLQSASRAPRAHAIAFVSTPKQW